MPVSRESFTLSHAMVSNKAPKGVTLEELRKMKRDIKLESFGLFDTSSPDFNKYYPDVKPEDLVPQDADFAYPIFRALSNIIINKYGPIDFTNKQMLKDSASKLIGQAVYTNHEMITGNEVGTVIECDYDESFKQDGFKIPGGINARLKLDGKANPKLIRSIMMEPPSVHSVSVTVRFMWEKSHDMDDDEFYGLMGGYDKDGKLYCRKVTEIYSYEEISLVPHGADPYAKRISGGKIANPAYADNQYSFSDAEYKELGHFFDWKSNEHDSISLSLDKTTLEEFNNNKNNNSKTMNKEYLKFLRTQIGLSDDAEESAVLAKLKETLPDMVKAGTDKAALQADLDKAKGDLTELQGRYPEGTVILQEEDKAKLDQFDGLKSVSDAALSSTRGEALKMYHISCGGAEKADTSITKLIAESNFEMVKALSKQYRKLAEEKFEATCNDCQSTNISRMSSTNRESGIATDEDTPTGKDGKTSAPKIRSMAEAMDDILAKQKKASLAHKYE